MSENFVDFHAIKQQVSLTSVLDRYGVKLRKVNQHSLRGKCPLPMHTSERSKESFGVHVGKNIWSCQSISCAAARQGKKGGNVLDFVSYMENCSVREAAGKLADWFPLSPKPAAEAHPKEPKTRELVAEKTNEGGGETVINKPLSFTLQGVDPSHPYIRRRGIKEVVARDFGVGFFPGRGSMQGRVVIPISNERGELVAYAGRAIDDETEPKYKLPSGFTKSSVVFNLDRVLQRKDVDVAVVVEGFFDCLKVHQAGIPEVVALMGSSMSQWQEEQLSKFNRLLLFLDGDEAGRQAAREIALRLMHRAFVQVITLPDGGQPDQLSSEEIASLLQTFVVRS